MTKTPTNRFIEKALESRSGPYVWLRKNHAEIAAAIAVQARPSWKALAKAAADDGTPFAPDTLRKAWQRLERDLARASATETGKPESLRPASADQVPKPQPQLPEPPGVPATPPASPPPATNDDNYKEITVTASDGKTTRTVRIKK